MSHVSGSPPNGTTSDTTAVVYRRAATISNRNRIPRGMGRFAISPQPWALTSVVLQYSENGVEESMLVTRTGTSSGRRELRRIACWECSASPITKRNVTVPNHLLELPTGFAVEFPSRDSRERLRRFLAK